MENKLNKMKIRIELARLDKNRTWLAKELGKSRQAFNYYWVNSRTDHVDKIADILKVDPNDLILR